MMVKAEHPLGPGSDNRRKTVRVFGHAGGAVNGGCTTLGGRPGAGPVGGTVGQRHVEDSTLAGVMDDVVAPASVVRRPV